MDETCFELVFSEENDDHGNCLTDLPTLFRFIPFDNFKTELEDKDELTKPEPDWLSLPNIIIKKEKFLGGGMWGSVFSCKFKDTDEQVIVKVANRRIYKYSSEFSIRDSVESLLDELNALKTIEHLPPHCDIIFPSFINQGYILIKTTKEYVRLPTIILKCPIGEPLKFQPEISISERKELAKNITTKIIEALKPIHELGYLHGDISSSNLLVLKDKFILIDWGLSHHYLEYDYINDFDYSALI
jgi:serine/threonine protein kinase